MMIAMQMDYGNMIEIDYEVPALAGVFRKDLLSLH